MKKYYAYLLLFLVLGVALHRGESIFAIYLVIVVLCICVITYRFYSLKPDNV